MINTTSLALRYTHFVATLQLKVAAEWGENIATGDYFIDTGGWRDYNPRECKGIEFEFEHDAMTFLHRVGGVYEKRSPVRDTGINY
jgi:hypothetical protein